MKTCYPKVKLLGGGGGGSYYETHVHTLTWQKRCVVPGQVSNHTFLNFSNQWHNHQSKGWCQGLLGEHAKPDNPFEEGSGAETTSNLLQRGHAQVSGLCWWQRRDLGTEFWLSYSGLSSLPVRRRHVTGLSRFPWIWQWAGDVNRPALTWG